MAITKTTTPTNRLRLVLGVCAVALLVMAGGNLFLPHQPLDEKTRSIAAKITAAHALKFSTAVMMLADMRQQQERLLAQKPADPYGWAQLSYLRNVTQGDAEGAFAALRMSDMVSPYEPRQLPERVLMWRALRAQQSDQEKAYLAVLWQKAAALQGRQTWDMAVSKNLVKEAEAALQPTPDLQKAWIKQENYTGHTH